MRAGHSAFGIRHSGARFAHVIAMGEQTIRSYRDLRVWREAMDLVEQCYRLAGTFPREEIYGLTSQIRRASVSIPSNIAEGYGRDSTGAYVQFLKIAQGSLKELETLLLVTERVLGTPAHITAPLLERCDVVGRMLAGLIRSLRSGDD